MTDQSRKRPTWLLPAPFNVSEKKHLLQPKNSAHDPLSIVTNAKCWWTEQRLPTLVLQQLYLAPVIHPGKWRVCTTHYHNWPQTSALKLKMLHLIWPPSSTGFSFNTSAPAVVLRCWSVVSGWETPPLSAPTSKPAVFFYKLRNCMRPSVLTVFKL